MIRAIFNFSAPTQEGQVGLPMIGIDTVEAAETEMNDPKARDRLRRRAFWALVTNRYGDVDEVTVTYHGIEED
jgi:hypothetical protein